LNRLSGVDVLFQIGWSIQRTLSSTDIFLAFILSPSLVLPGRLGRVAFVAKTLSVLVCPVARVAVDMIGIGRGFWNPLRFAFDAQCISIEYDRSPFSMIRSISAFV